MALLQTSPETNSKRYLSSHSSSPKYEKKTKSFTSPNRFTVLSTANDELVSDVFTSNSDATEREQLPPSQNVLKSIHMPAIYVKHIRNFSEFHKKLIHLTGINDFSCKSAPSYLIIRASSHPAFATISKYLISTSAEFHTFRPHYMHHFKVVICNLHDTTILSNISDALVEHGHSVVRVGNIRKKQCPLPLFHVKLALKNKL
jgi:hypothetical protein